MSTRQRQVRRVLWIALLLNLLVAAAKAVYGAMSGSLAIASDAIHSIVDASSNIIGLVVIRLAAAPPDVGHPYGHRKLEIVAAAGIGVAISYAAVRFTWSAIESLLHGRAAPDTSLVGFVVLAVTLVINIAVARYEAGQARQLDSAYLAADAGHTASDVFVTCGVMVSFAASHAGWTWADPIGALVVIAVICRVAWTIVRENISVLIDRAAIDHEALDRAVRSVSGVRGCHRVRSRGLADAIQIDLHLLLDGDAPLREAHRIAHAVEDALRAQIPGISDVTIHMEPEDDGFEAL